MNFKLKKRISLVFLSLATFCSECGVIASERQSVNAEQNWADHEYSRYSGCGRASLLDKDYQKAAEYFAQALTFKYESYAATEEAKCYMQMKEWEKARRVLKILMQKQGYQEEFALLIECDLNLKMYKQALDECDTFEREQISNDGVWLQRNKIYAAMGNLYAAKDSLKQGYFRCVREGKDRNEYEFALKNMHETIPTVVPHVMTANREVIDLIRYLASLKSPENEEEIASNIERITGRKQNFRGDGSAGNWRADNWSAPTGAFEISSKYTGFRVNLNLSYVTKEDLLSAKSKLFNTAEKWIDESQRQTPSVPGAPIVSTPEYLRFTYRFDAPDGDIALTFNQHDPKQLAAVGRNFSDASVSNFLRDQFANTVKTTEQLIGSGQHEQAAKYLVQHWPGSHIDLNTDGAQERVATLKALLAKALKYNPAVEQYVLAAPFLAINEDIVRTRFDVSKLPTIDEFKKNRWSAWLVSSYDGDRIPNISASLSGYSVCGCWITSHAPLYKIIYDEIGADWAPDGPRYWIKPISGSDADTFIHH